jgi:hypothetical protein
LFSMTRTTTRENPTGRTGLAGGCPRADPAPGEGAAPEDPTHAAATSAAAAEAPQAW